MLQVYLPIAEVSVNLLVMLGLGAAVGFLSGMFGVGGGFLLTPLLMFSGVRRADRGRDRRQSNHRHIGVGCRRAMAARQYRPPHGQCVDRWRRGRRDDWRRAGQTVARGRSGGPLHLAHVCRFSRRHRRADAGREHPRHSQVAFRKADSGPPRQTRITGFTACRSRCASRPRGSISAPSRPS